MFFQSSGHPIPQRGQTRPQSSRPAPSPIIAASLVPPSPATSAACTGTSGTQLHSKRRIALQCLPWLRNHKATRTNVHFVDIVRPPLEDFQPIALRLRLALLGIYIGKLPAGTWHTPSSRGQLFTDSVADSPDITRPPQRMAALQNSVSLLRVMPYTPA